MMDFTVLSSHRAEHQLAHQAAMIEGLKCHGIVAKKSFSEAHINTKYVACWGWRVGNLLRAKGHEVLVMERGYLGDRFKYSSLGWNGLNGRASFPEYPDDGGERFNQISFLHPWKKDGKYVLIMGQVPGDQALGGRDLAPWYKEMADQAINKYLLPVVFRQHPEAKKKGFRQFPKGTLASKGTLNRVLENAAIVITYNSNAAVDAVINGIPALSLDPGSMAWDVTGHEVGDVLYPEREKWAHALAWKQWTIAEITSGIPLKPLLDMIP